jgi:hypothetical protein
MRQLVTEYVVMNIKWLEKDPSFEELLQGGGEFPVDFWRMFRKEQECAATRETDV